MRNTDGRELNGLRAGHGIEWNRYSDIVSVRTACTQVEQIGLVAVDGFSFRLSTKEQLVSLLQLRMAQTCKLGADLDKKFLYNGIASRSRLGAHA